MIQTVFGCFLSSQKQIRLYVDTDFTTTDYVFRLEISISDEEGLYMYHSMWQKQKHCSGQLHTYLASGLHLCLCD